jgi:hypothetical protein
MRLIRERMGGSSVVIRPRTPGELLARLGRLVLWLAVVLVLARGAADLFATGRPTTRPGVQRIGQRLVWPDDAARAFAVEFASAYLHQSARDEPGDYARRLAGFASAELAAELVPRLDDRRPSQAVEAATAAGSVPVDNRRALVTVAVRIAVVERVTTRLVTVPVARDERGGLVVYDLPSFAPSVGRAKAARPQSEPLPAADRAEIEEVVARFLRAYLAGAADDLTYLVPPGVRIDAVAGRFELASRVAVAEPVAAAQSRDGRLVLATVEARDVETRAVYALRYRLRLVRRDRWYVADINGPGTGKR